MAVLFLLAALALVGACHIIFNLRIWQVSLICLIVYILAIN